MKRPTFNTPGSTEALYCKLHALEGMINVKHKRCADLECTKIPNFNTPESMEALYCKLHALEGMIDIKHKRCVDPDCTKRPTFNAPGSTEALYCKLHALEGMINVKDKRCVLCKIFQSTKRYNWYCFGCYCFTFPDKVIVRNHKTKENQIMADLKKIYPNIIQDKIVSGGCSKRRPDGLIQLNDYNIIIEIDENQHNSTEYSCENKRMMEIFQDLGDSPLTVIRFNPDKFAKEQSLFKNSKKEGKLLIRNQKKYDIEIAKLVETIAIHISTRPDSEVNVVLLRYD